MTGSGRWRGDVPDADTFQEWPKNSRVYYTHYVNSSRGWYNPTTFAVGYKDVSGKQNSFDNLEAIAAINGGMAFFGRNETQIWVGTDPTLTSGDIQFIWSKTLPVGIAHPRLLAELPNDVAIITPYGARTLSSINETQQFSVDQTIGAPVDLAIIKQLKNMSRNNYLQAARVCLSQGEFRWLSGRHGDLCVCADQLQPGLGRVDWRLHHL